MKENKIKASILVVNFNNANYLDECLESMFKQTYDYKEIIFLDDESTDKSQELLKNYENKIKIVKKNYKKKNIPSYDQFKSYYECLSQSKGEVIFFCDSDDYFLENKIEKVINKFENDKDCKILFDLPIIKSQSGFETKKLKKKLINTYWPYIPPTSCIAIKKNFLFKILDQFDFTQYTDLWLDFRLGIYSKYKLEKIDYLPNNLTVYRQTDMNISSKFKFNSSNWWKRRMQAHQYLKYFLLKNDLKYNKNFDYYFTNLINLFLR